MVEINDIIVHYLHYSIYNPMQQDCTPLVLHFIINLRLEHQQCICVSIVVLLLQLHVLVHQLDSITLYYI